MASAFDTLGYAKKLRDRGVPQDQAEAHAEAAREFIMGRAGNTVRSHDRDRRSSARDGEPDASAHRPPRYHARRRSLDPCRDPAAALTLRPLFLQEQTALIGARHAAR